MKYENLEQAIDLCKKIKKATHLLSEISSVEHLPKVTLQYDNGVNLIKEGGIDATYSTDISKLCESFRKKLKEQIEYDIDRLHYELSKL